MITQKITLDFYQPFSGPIKWNQYEVDARQLEITCTAGSLPIDVAAATVVFYAKKPDGNILYNACTILDTANGKVLYTATGDTCTAAGGLQCWIVIDKTGSSLRSMDFAVTVRPSPDDSEAIEGESEFTALTEALATIAGLDARLDDVEAGLASLAPSTKRFELTSAQSAANSGVSYVDWNTSPYDVGVDTPTRKSAGVFEIKAAGVYRVTVNISFASNATGTRRVFIGRYQSDGSTSLGIIADDRRPANASNQTLINLSAEQRFGLGETLRIGAVQTSDGALNIGPNTDTAMTVTLISRD